MTPFFPSFHIKNREKNNSPIEMLKRSYYSQMFGVTKKNIRFYMESFFYLFTQKRIVKENIKKTISFHTKYFYLNLKTKINHHHYYTLKKSKKKYSNQKATFLKVKTIFFNYIPL